jgi:hypothetical protein
LTGVAAGDKEAEFLGLCPRPMSLLNSFFIGSSPLIAGSESQAGILASNSDLADLLERHECLLTSKAPFLANPHHRELLVMNFTLAPMIGIEQKDDPGGFKAQALFTALAARLNSLPKYSQGDRFFSTGDWV